MRNTRLTYICSTALLCSLALALAHAHGAGSKSVPAPKPADRIAVLAESGAVAELVADGLRHEAKLPAIVVDAETVDIAIRQTQARIVVRADLLWDAKNDENQDLPEKSAEPAARAAAIVKTVAYRTGHDLSDRAKEAIIRRAGSNSEALAAWAQARAAMRANKLPDANTAARKAVALAPEAAYAHAELSFVLSAMGKTGDALRSAQKALELDAASPLGLLAKAKALDYANDLATAAKAYEEVLALSPYEYPALINLGIIRFRNDYDYASAAELLERASHANPSRVESAVNLARAYAETGKAGHAVELLTEAKAKAPGNQRVRLYLAEALSRAGKHAAAKEELRTLSTQNSFEVYFIGSQIALASGDAAAAQELANKARAMMPQSVDAMHLIGRAMELGGDTEGARKLYEEALVASPRLARLARRNLSILLALGKELEMATKLLDDGLEFSERDAEAHYNRGVASLAANDFSQAQIKFEEAHTLAPYLSAAAYNAGLLAARGGNLSAARDWLRKALASDADADPEVELALGVVLGKLGEWQEAETHLKLAAKSMDSATRVQAEESLALVQHASGDPEAVRGKLEALRDKPGLSPKRKAGIEALLAR